MGIVGMLLGKVEDLSWVLKVSVVSWGAKNAKDTVAEGGGWDNQVKVPEAENWAVSQQKLIWPGQVSHVRRK